MREEKAKLWAAADQLHGRLDAVGYCAMIRDVTIEEFAEGQV